MNSLKYSVISKFLFKERLNKIREKKSLYDSMDGNFSAISKFQLERFNKVWDYARVNIPFYAYWASQYNLPDRLESISELKKFPVLTKDLLQQHESLIFKEGKSYQTVVTGGSTGQPTKFITTPSEKNIEYANTYLGRGAFGIEPLQPTILFWGHSHLFGSGLNGKINEVKRQVLDSIVSIKRLNAYDLSTKTIESYVKLLGRLNADCIIGYTSSIYSISRFILDNQITLPLFRKLKGVIVTSETVTDHDVSVINAAFGCPVVIEYGMAETSVVAYSTPKESGLRIFWDSFIAQTSNNNELNLTTIYERQFPLINYATKDVIEPLIEHESSLIRINNIKGRSRDNVKIRTLSGDSLELSGILLIHIMKGFSGLFSISYKQFPNNEVEVYVVPQEGTDVKRLQNSFKAELIKDHPEIDLSAIKVIETSEVQRTIAGKTLMKVD